MGGSSSLEAIAGAAEDHTRKQQQQQQQQLEGDGRAAVDTLDSTRAGANKWEESAHYARRYSPTTTSPAECDVTAQERAAKANSVNDD